jgi:hypothetical protein
MAEILGTSPSEMVGPASFDYLFPDDIEEAQRLFGREDARRHEATSCSSSHHHLLFCQSWLAFRGQLPRAAVNAGLFLVCHTLEAQQQDDPLGKDSERYSKNLIG